MPGLSVIVSTYNEENNIRECLESVKWADEIIVIDSNSKDRTVEIAKKFTDKVFISETKSFSEKKNYGIDKASCEWILWIDADERVPDSLKKEIRQIISTTANDTPVFKIGRKSFFINRFIKHCGWHPDYGIRLFKKSTGIKFSVVRVHERIDYDGKSKKLKNEIIHYTDLTFEHYISKLNSYTTSSALDSHENGKESSISDIIFRPVFTFLKMYFLKLGFLDGYTGLVLCTLSSTHVFVKYSKLYWMKQNKSILKCFSIWSVHLKWLPCSKWAK
jgi:glycosyltransferase involved in cell wall biosynthesis